MIAELGHFALVLALCVALAQGLLPLAGAARGHAPWMALALAIAALAFAETTSVWPIMVIATGFGIANAFDIPARHTLYGDLVEKEQLISAVALNSSSFNASRIVGPVIAGFILNAWGAAWCFLLNGLSYIAVLWGLFSMKVPPFRPSVRPKRR